MMRKQRTSTSSILRRAAALVFRLCLLAAIWHAPLPAISVHADTGDGVDEYNYASRHSASSYQSACEFRLVLPCQLNGCGNSSLPRDDSDSDHSRHIASLDYGALGKPQVNLNVTGQFYGAVLRPMTLAAAVHHPSLPLNFAASRVAAAHLVNADDAPTLPLRANLQVFLI